MNFLTQTTLWVIFHYQLSMIVSMGVKQKMGGGGGGCLVTKKKGDESL